MSLCRATGTVETPSTVPCENSWKDSSRATASLQRKCAQLYTAGTPTTKKINNKAKTKSATICLENSVTYDKDDTKVDGTGTSTPAQWDGWIQEDYGSNLNATQMHVVNSRWGGKGDSASGNLVPGTASMNHHHTGQEHKFDTECFGGTNKTKAIKKCTYKCKMKDSSHFDTADAGGKKEDPALEVVVTPDPGTAVTLDVKKGSSGGLKFPEGLAQ